MAKKIIGPALVILLLTAVGSGIYYSATDEAYSAPDNAVSGRVAVPAALVVQINGLTGSEKLGYLEDVRVQGVAGRNGLQVVAKSAGSREMAIYPKLKQQDFAFPAGAPGANKIKKETNAGQDFTPFYSVMVVASWKPIAELLEKNGIAKKKNGTWYLLDMQKLMTWMKEGKRWKDVPGNTVYPVNKSVLISTSDVAKSNSAAMYLALTSFLANNNDVVASEQDVQKVLPIITPLYLKQGYQESSSAGPFDDYVTMGIGKAPLVMIYEAQFIEYLAKTPPAARNPDMVLMYPTPTVFTKHTLVPFTESGVRFGRLLTTDPELQRVAAEHGLRINNAAEFLKIQKGRGLEVPESILDVIDPPSYEWLERMIKGIEHNMQSTGHSKARNRTDG